MDTEEKGSAMKTARAMSKKKLSDANKEIKDSCQNSPLTAGLTAKMAMASMLTEAAMAEDGLVSSVSQADYLKAAKSVAGRSVIVHLYVLAMSKAVNDATLRSD